VLTSVAAALETGSPDAHLMVVLVDERPEDVTEVRRMLHAEVVASASDRPAEEHLQVAELALERAKRMVEQGRDVVLVLDGITRLARSYNLANPGSGRIVSGGIDPAAVQAAKAFFGAARNTEEAGSLTILAAVLIGSGSGVDEVVFEEIEGTATMQVRLDRSLADRRLYPAIDVARTSTRREELLYDPTELDQVRALRRSSTDLAEGEGGSAASLERLLARLDATRTRSELLAELATSPAPSA
jgi:transcription termination factor Rho